MTSYPGVHDITQLKDAGLYDITQLKTESPLKKVTVSYRNNSKLPTQDRMVWAQGNDLRCALCKSCVDNHSHLFFECSYSWKDFWPCTKKNKYENALKLTETLIPHHMSQTRLELFWGGTP